MLDGKTCAWAGAETRPIPETADPITNHTEHVRSRQR